MRTVHPSRMVAHLWANQSQFTARNSGNTVYFRDSTIYSYGNHFPMARIVTNKRGEKVVLHNSDHRSVTTSGHQSMVRRAASHLPAFTVPYVDDRCANAHKFNLEHYDKAIEQAFGKASRARSNAEWYVRTAQELIAEGNRYAKFFGLKKRFAEPPNYDLETLREKAAEYRRKHEAKLRREEKARQERQRQAEQEQRERLVQWMAGEDVYVRTSGEHFLRLKDAEAVETTGGAEFPLRDALLTLPLIRSGREWHSNGELSASASST